MIEKDQRIVTALDRIIEKFTATPRKDPDVVDYSLRQELPRSRRRKIKSRRGTMPSQSQGERKTG